MTTRPTDVAAALASAFLAEGAWTAEALRDRGTVAVGRRAFVRPVAAEVLASYREPPRERPRELRTFVLRCKAFRAAVDRAADRGRPVARVRTWLPAAPARLQLVAPTLPPIATPKELARWLGLTDAELDFYADTRSWERRRTPDDRLRNHSCRWVPTRSGERLLERPRPVLCGLQRHLLHGLVGRIPLHDAAHGFVPARSVHTFAAPHASRAIVVRVDLRGFFSSIGAGRVWSVLRVAGYSEQVAHLLTGLATNAVPAAVLHGRGTPRQRRLLAQPRLAQGAPTSPAYANLAAANLDRRLAGLAAARGFRYTRYADDLAFSTDARSGADALLSAIHTIVTDEGFAVHPDKVSVQRSGGRQRLAGLVVNDRPRLARAEVDRLRATLHEAAVHGPSQANRAGVADFRAHLTGRVAWASYRDPVRAHRLATMLAAIDWTRA